MRIGRFALLDVYRSSVTSQATLLPLPQAVVG
jgi:hypothetical protein